MPKPLTHKRTTAKVFHYAQELLHNQTPAETKLWSCLRNHQLNGLGFRRQHAIGPFIVDFCCPAHKLTVELDGDSHANQVTYDQERTNWLQDHGWHELRIRNTDVTSNIDAVLAAILEAAEEDRSINS